MTIAEFRLAGRWLARVLATILMAVIAAPAMAANYPLELVLPRAVGTAPAAGNAAITSTHRIFRAYPGLEYNIRAVVIGGAYPYTFSLSNAPTGMTIDENNGTIVWPNPQSNASPTITVIDSEGTRVTSSWAISVTTSGFRFIDAVNGSSLPAGTGTITNPWRSISDMVSSPTAGGGDIAYFRTGTYTALNLPRGSIGTVWERVGFSSGSKPTTWLAYPGASPVIDFGYNPGVDTGVLFRFEGDNTYIDGFQTRNSRVIGFQLTSGPGSHFRVLRRLRMRDHNVTGESYDGSNASFIMMTSSYSESDSGGNAESWAQYLTIQDCEFNNSPAQVALKVYSQWKMLIEDNTFRDVYDAAALKADIPRFTYRANKHYEIAGQAIGGNMHSATTSGEILFNLVNSPSGRMALDVNQDGQTRRVDVYRNTFAGHILVRNVNSTSGPFRFYNNIIVNGDAGSPSGSHINQESISDGTRVTMFDNLTGYPSSNIIDAAGGLSPSYMQYLGTRGYQTGVSSTPPSPPGNVIVE